MKSDKIINLTQETAELLNGDFDITQSGVPRIIYKRENISASIVYVANLDMWKAFFPFPAIAQKKLYFCNLDQLKRWLKSWE